VGQEYFAIDEASEPNLHVFAQDGRWYLDNTRQMYDMIAIDAYRQPYIPFHLTTQEFFISVRDHLSERGVAAINCGRTATDYRLVNALASTMRSVFPCVYIIDEPNLGRALGNSLVVATKQPTSKENLGENLDQVSNPILRQVAAEIVESPREYFLADVVLTDDWAPVEWLVDRMMWEHAWGG
jgi:spermidine synthase